MSVPYTFASATSPIPLSELDDNFATGITLGGTTVYLGGTYPDFQTSGYSGYSGSGTSGYSGKSGYSGIGFSGGSGASGYSGYSGI